MLVKVVFIQEVLFVQIQKQIFLKVTEQEPETTDEETAREDPEVVLKNVKDLAYVH